MNKTKDFDFICIDIEFDNSIKKAKNIYLEGGVFIYPTDTIYGLGANPFNEDAIKKVNQIKGRKETKNYILLADSVNTVAKYTELNSEKHLDFLQSIWPNPVSVVITLNKRTSSILHMYSAAFRIPNHRFCRQLAAELKMPIISTSVNRTGSAPLNQLELIKQEFSSEVSGIFYTHKSYFDKVSTLIDLTGDDLVLLREGKIKFEELTKKYK